MTSFQKIINKELQNRNILSHGFFITMNEHHRVYQYMRYKKNSYTSQDDEIWIPIETKDGETTYEPFFSTKEMNMKHQSFDKFNTNHVKLVSEAADERKIPFEKKNNKLNKMNATSIKKYL